MTFLPNNLINRTKFMVGSTHKNQPFLKKFPGKDPRPPSIKRFPLPAKNPVWNPVLVYLELYCQEVVV